MKPWGYLLGFAVFLSTPVSSQTIHTTTLWEYFECIDGDGGIEPYVKSYVYSNHSTSRFDTTELKNEQSNFSGMLNDSCLDGNTLWEYFCQENKYSVKLVNCSFGCEDGACIKAEATSLLHEKSTTPKTETSTLKKLKSFLLKILEYFSPAL